MIMDTPEIITPIIESALIRKQAAEAAAITKAKKKAKKAKIAKHVPASGIDTPGVETTLFLTEGDSAVGQFIECRNEETQGAFPLRGKPLNTWGMSFTDIIKNKEQQDTGFPPLLPSKWVHIFASTHREYG